MGRISGILWNTSGTKLGEATFTGETSSSWQTVSFGTSPVPISANTTYVVSYFSPSGYYSSSNPYFTAPTTNGLPHRPANGTDGVNGIWVHCIRCLPDK